MRIVAALVALSGLLVWEAWAERTRHRIKLLLERLPALFVQITVDMTAWQLAMTQAAEATEELARRFLDRYREPVPSQHVVGNAIDVSFNVSLGTEIDVVVYGEDDGEDDVPREVIVTRPGHPPQTLEANVVDWSGWGEEWAPLGCAMSWTQAPDDSWVDAYQGQGEELEALDQVIEEQRERIRRIR